MRVPVEQQRIDVDRDEHAGEERDEAVDVGHGERGPPRQAGATGEQHPEQHARREQRVRDDPRCAGRVPVDSAHDVAVATGGATPDGGAIEPPSSV